jgi:hypothetical protein
MPTMVVESDRFDSFKRSKHDSDENAPFATGASVDTHTNDVKTEVDNNAKTEFC